MVMKMNKKTIAILLQISVLLVTVFSSLATAADSEPPELPMILSGKVTNENTGEWAPEGTIIVARASETGNDLGATTVGANGVYGDAINNKLIVNKCTSFDVYAIVDGSEVKISTFDWESGATLKGLDESYSYDSSGNTQVTGDDGSSARSRSYHADDITSSSIDNAEGIDNTEIATGDKNDIGAASASATEGPIIPSRSELPQSPKSTVLILLLIGVTVIASSALYIKYYK
jgi:hypothetical protein